MKNHGQHDHARPWYAGGTDRGEGSGEHYGDHLSQAQINAEGRGDKDGTDTLVDGSTVHIDGGPQGQDKGGHLTPGTQPLGTLQRKGQRPY